MPNRTCKLYGKVWGNPSDPAVITVNFNGQQYYHGSVPTTPGLIDRQIGFGDMIVMASWEIPLDTPSPNEFVFSITNGDAIVHVIHANYMGNRILSWKFQPDIEWPAFIPSTAEEVVLDINQMQPTDFQIKYDLDKNQARARMTSDVYLLTQDNWNDITGSSTIESDGYDNVKIDGAAQIRVANQDTLGKWIWPVLNNQTLTCLIQSVPAQL